MKKSKLHATAHRRPGPERWLSLGLFCITSIVYVPSLANGFIDYYDDNQYVLMNPHVNAGLTAAGLAWLPTGVVVANWHPLTNLTHMLDVQLYGLIPWGHHLTSILLHALGTVLLYLLLKRMTGAPWASGLVAALFALHPMHVESVAWIAERKDVLSACLWFLTTLAYVRYVRAPGPWTYGLVLLLFALALMAKAMVVTLPFTLLLLDYWPLGRVPADADRADTVRRWTRLVVEKIPLLLLAGGTAAVTFALQKADATLKPLDLFPLSLRIENAVISYVRYLVKFVWPIDLSFYYPLVDRPIWQWMLASAILLGITAVVLWQARRRPYLLVGWLWYVGTLFPVIQLLQTGSHAMADRYSYIPSIGIFVMVAWLLKELVSDEATRRRFGAVCAALALGALSVVTYFQQSYWKDSETLFRHALAIDGDNPVAHYLLGALYMGQGRLVDAEKHINEGLRVFPDGRLGHFALGSVQYMRGDYPAAVESFRTAARTGVEDGTAHFWAGRTLDRMGKQEDAEREYRQALEQFDATRRRQPRNAGAAMSAGIVAERLGRKDEALARYREAAELDPALTQARDAIARLSAGQ